MSDLFISIGQAENDLLAAAAYIGERIKSSDGHAEAMNTVLPLYLARGEVDLSAELANSVDDPYSRDKFLTLVAEKCAEIDDDEYALQLAEAIEDVGIQSQALERVALALAGKGHIEKAREIADNMAHPDFVLAGIAAKQAEDGDAAAARETVGDIDFPSAKVAAIQHIASTLIAGDAPEESVTWLETGVEAAIEIEHDEEKIRSLCDIAAHFVEAKRNDKAIETYDVARGLAELLDNSMRDFFLGSCALGFLGAGSLELADQTLDLVTDKTQMASALVGFARESWKKDEKTEALDTLDEAYAILRSQREIEIRDSRSRNRLLTVVAVQFAGFGKTERGVELAHENPDPSEETEALTQIAQILVVQNEDELARQTIDEIAEDADRMFSLISLADAKLKLGDAVTALALLDEAVSMADAIPQLAARSNALNEIAFRFAEQGNVVKAREICRVSLATVNDIRDDSSQAACLAALSQVYFATNMELGDDERSAIEILVRGRDK